MAVGTRSVRGAARGGRLAAALIARDASDNAGERVRSLLDARGVPVVLCGTKDALGGACGRGPTAVVGITDRALAGQALASLGCEAAAG